MEAIHCPNCHRLLPENSQYCVACGEVFAPDDAELQDVRAGQEVEPSAGGSKKTRPLAEMSTLRSPWVGRRITSSLLDEEYEEGELDLEAEPRHETWQKVVETPARPPAVHPPRPPLPPQSHAILKHMPYGHTRLSPALLFWCSMVVLFFFVGGGVFGIVGSIGRGRDAVAAGSSLQITPDSVAIGATMNLRGIGFSPHAQIGLTRDAAIPLVDTNETTIVTTRADGSFTDTIVVGPDWVAGTHTIRAEDSITHRFTSSPIQVTGMGDLLRPAHLNLSVTALDFGAGDPAINSVKKVSLTNLGGGQISWKAAASQPWVTISPQGGTFSSGMRTDVEIAVDRANLQPGPFSDQILFSSSAGDSTLPVTMNVVPLPVQPSAALQVSPPALSFTGSDGSASPGAQAVTISNPGQALLHWTATTSAPWLSLSSNSGSVDVGASAQLKANVNSRNLLPGTYNGTITLQEAGGGSATRNVHSIPVSVTITPGCALTVAPDMLAFTGAYQQSAPVPKTLNLGTANCSSAITWNATAHAPWLTLSRTSGSTATDPTVGINMVGLQPGTYNSSITFSSSSGTQEVPVRLFIAQPAAPALSIESSGNLKFHGVAGQDDMATQNVTLANTGNGTLFWNAKAITGGSGNWLSVSPGSGSITAHQSRSLTVTCRVRADMQAGTYFGAVNIAATDARGGSIDGSPQHMPVSVAVDAPTPPAKPSVQLSATNVAFSSVAGTNPTAQNITLNNTGNTNVNWQVGKPSQPWLTVSPRSGSDVPGASSTITLSADVAGLTPGTYQATAVLRTASSSAMIVTASLTLTKATPVATPSPMPQPTAVPTPEATSVPTPQAQPTPEVTPTTQVVPSPSPNPATPTPSSRGAPPPVATSIPSPSPHPTTQPRPQPTVMPSPTQSMPGNNPQSTPTKTISTAAPVLPTPTITTGRNHTNYVPPANNQAEPSPTTPPDVSPTETPAAQATPTPEQNNTNSEPEDEPTPTPKHHKNVS